MDWEDEELKNQPRITRMARIRDHLSVPSVSSVVVRLTANHALSCCMTPHEATSRLRELGASLDVADLRKVRWLHIKEEPIRPEFTKMIAEMLPRHVTLNGLQMSVDDIPALLHFPRLRDICAHGIAFAATLLDRLATYPRLESVALSYTSIQDRDVLPLANLPNLTSIHFAGTQLTNDALVVFGALPKLEILDLRDTRVTDDGLLHLANLRNLFNIDVRGTTVTSRGADAFRNAVARFLPDVEVLFGAHVGG